MNDEELGRLTRQAIVMGVLVVLLVVILVLVPGCESLPQRAEPAVVEPPVFRWAPDANQIGEHEVTFTASDGQASDSATVVITVVPKDTNVYYDGRLHWLIAKEGGGWVNLVDLARLRCPQ